MRMHRVAQRNEGTPTGPISARYYISFTLGLVASFTFTRSSGIQRPKSARVVATPRTRKRKPSSADRGSYVMTSVKIRPQHLERKPILCVRQSSVHQVLYKPGEQRAATYNARSPCGARLAADRDYRRRSWSATSRAGFDRMVAQVCSQGGCHGRPRGSRFARSSRDWQQLIEMCRVVDTWKPTGNRWPLGPTWSAGINLSFSDRNGTPATRAGSRRAPCLGRARNNQCSHWPPEDWHACLSRLSAGSSCGQRHQQVPLGLGRAAGPLC